MEALTPVTQNVTLPGNMQKLEETRKTLPPEEGMALPTPSFQTLASRTMKEKISIA